VDSTCHPAMLVYYTGGDFFWIKLLWKSI
jgi:hypothetical protein